MDPSLDESYARVKARLKMRLAELTSGAANGGVQTPAQSNYLKEQLRQALRSLPTKEYRGLRISREGEEDRLLHEVMEDAVQTASAMFEARFGRPHRGRFQSS